MVQLKELMSGLKYLISLNKAKFERALFIIILAVLCFVIKSLYAKNVTLSNQLNNFYEQYNDKMTERNDANQAKIDAVSRYKDSVIAARDAQITKMNQDIKDELDKIKNARTEVKKIKKSLR